MAWKQIKSHPKYGAIPWDYLDPVTVEFLKNPMDWASSDPDISSKITEHLRLHPYGDRSNPISAAIQHSTLDEILTLLKSGHLFCSPELKLNQCPSYIYPLHLSAELGRIDVAIILILFGAPVDSVDWNGITPFHYAANKRQIPMVQALIQMGSLAINQRDDEGDTPMHFVCQSWTLDRKSKYKAPSASAEATIRALLHFGGSATIVNRKGQTPLHYAARKAEIGAIEVLGSILDPYWIDLPDKKERTAIFMPSDASNLNEKTVTPAVEILLKYGSQSLMRPNVRGRTVMHMAVMQHTTEAVAGLLGLGYTAIDFPDAKGRTLIELSLREYFPEHSQVLPDWLKDDFWAKIDTPILLKAVGVKTEIEILDQFARRHKKFLRQPLPESQILEIRFQVYFAATLVTRLIAMIL